MKPHTLSLVALAAVPLVYSSAIMYSSVNAGNRVGEPMPIISSKSHQLLGQSIRSDTSRGPGCVWLEQYFTDANSDSLRYRVLMPSHNSQGFAFAVIDYKANETYIDRDVNWVIDRVVSQVDINPIGYHPNCSRSSQQKGQTGSPKSQLKPRREHSFDNSG